MSHSLGTQVVADTPEEGVKYLTVTDTTCTPEYPKRTHDFMYQGRRAQVTFELAKGACLNLPIDIALKFLKDEAFEVVDPDTGSKYDPTPKQPDAAGASFELGPDEVVAKLDELTREALFIRAKQLPGSDDLKPNSPKEKLVAFMAASSLRKKQPKGRDDIDAIQPGSTVGGALTPDALAELLPDDDA